MAKGILPFYFFIYKLLHFKYFLKFLNKLNIKINLLSKAKIIGFQDSNIQILSAVIQDCVNVIK